MDIADARAQIEEDITWRQEEIRQLQEVYVEVSENNEALGLKLRKCLWVILYAHCEGSFRFALTVYAQVLSRASIRCGDANEFIATVTLAPVFSALESGDGRDPLFSSLPDGKDLHRLYRRVTFIRNIRELEDRLVDVPEKHASGGRSSFDYDTVKKPLYQMGFDQNAFEPYSSTIAQLSFNRHKIAHGDRTAKDLALSHKHYLDVRRAVFRMMSDMTIFITDSLVQGKYLQA